MAGEFPESSDFKMSTRAVCQLGTTFESPLSLRRYNVLFFLKFKSFNLTISE